MTEPIKALLFGAGDRGAGAYGKFALENPDKLRFVAVAEPRSERREKFVRDHQIPLTQVFNTWQEALSSEKIADVVINATQDSLHYESGVAALHAGYDMLLEKPIAPTLAQSVELVQTAETLGRRLMICHVLRYTEFFEALQQVLRSGRLGQLVTVSWRENVGAFHMAHSYVRGNWRKSNAAAPMILAKCCHDLDLLTWYLDEPIQSLSSTGSLLHFRPENAPEGAPLRCTDGCPAWQDCPFYAPAIYRDMLPIKYSLLRSDKPALRVFGKWIINNPAILSKLRQNGALADLLSRFDGWPRSVITDHPEDDRSVMQALQEGPYGRCVYHCDNDVVDHQIVTMATQNGVSVSLTMHGHSYEEGRTLRIDGSRATLLGKFSLAQVYLELWDQRGFLLERRLFHTEIEPGQSGHGGGDAGLMNAFVRALRGEEAALDSGRAALESHLLAFAAEEARLEQKVVRMDEFRQLHDV